MFSARRKVLTMLHEGKLTVDQAEELLDSLDAPDRVPTPSIPRVELVGESAWSRQFRKTIDQVAGTQSPVLVQGETGTGKELIARMIHYNSSRANGPFVTLSTQQSDTMINSEIFGHEEGAFTGAVRAKKGLLDVANEGTLLLDGVDLLSPDTQQSLLSFLQNGYFTRVGGTRPIYSDVRLIVATNRDLRQLADQGAFRSDLYYLLSVARVQSAPLRERREDIPVLTAYFLEKLAERDGRKPPGISEEAQKILNGHSWPHNVRQLAHVVGRSAVLCENGEIGPEMVNRVLSEEAA